MTIDELRLILNLISNLKHDYTILLGTSNDDLKVKRYTTVINYLNTQIQEIKDKIDYASGLVF